MHQSLRQVNITRFYSYHFTWFLMLGVLLLAMIVPSPVNAQEQFELKARTWGDGRITSQTGELNCGSICQANYIAGSTVQITATPAPGYQISEWRGVCHGNAPSCEIVMQEDLRVGAVFERIDSIPPDTIELKVKPTNDGRIYSVAPGIDCGSDCREDYEIDTIVELVAVPNAGFELRGWLGDCVTTSTDRCQLALSQDRRAGVEFQPISSPQRMLSVNVTTGGQVNSTPEGILCGSDCNERFIHGTPVVLTAFAESGYSFSGWSGACSGSGDCELLLDTDQSVSARFSPVVTDDKLHIEDMGLHSVAWGETFRYQPTIRGNFSICRKDLGHDDVTVDSQTGEIVWDTSGLAFGRGFPIRIKCSSFTETAYASMVVHVDRSGNSRLRVAGEDGVSAFIGEAGQAMNSGDTIVFPDGLYPVSVSADESFENAFKNTAPTDGTALQFSTLIARSPGGVIVSGAAHGDIPKQKNIFQLSETHYVALSGFVLKDSQRESLTTTGSGHHLLIEFVGAAGAGTEGRSCANFSEAAAGVCSKAGMRINGGTPLFQHSYDWGHNRYGIMTRGTSGSITRRSFVRLDEHRGDQPYGGFSHYCDIQHLSQDNTVFDSLAIAAPHYKNYAGLAAYPATGCEHVNATLKTEGLFAVNNKLSLSLMDQKAGPEHIWDHIVSFDSEGTCTPQTNRCGNWLLQADKLTQVRHSFFGKARGYDGSTNGAAFHTNISLDSSVSLADISGYADVGIEPDYLPRSLLYYRGRSDTFYGDANANQLTRVRRWPIGGEDIIAANMRSYDNPHAIAVGGGEVHVVGDRGAVASGDSMSEYFWGYTNQYVPPLVVRVKDKPAYHRVAWEPLTGAKRNEVTGWKVLCTSADDMVLMQLSAEQLVYHHYDKSCQRYGVVALYTSGESGYAYSEAPDTTAADAVKIADYRAVRAPFQLPEVGNNGSGITWHPQLQQYLVLRNGAGITYRYDEDFSFLGQITRGGNINSDMEGLEYLSDHQVMIVTERNMAHKAEINGETTVINGNYDVTPAYRLLPPPVSNKGLEGVAVRPAADGVPARIYVCQEGTRSDDTALMEFVYFDLPSPDPETLMSYDLDLTVVTPFDAESAFAGVISDCSGMVYDTRSGHIIIVSQESSRAVQIDPQTGVVISTLELSGAPWYEGVTFGPNGELVFMSEPNWVHMFQR